MKNRIPPWLRAIISLGLVVYIFSQLDISRAWENIHDVRIDLILLALGLTVLDRLFFAYRWYVLLHTRRSMVSYRDVVHLVFVSGFVGLFMPGAIGTELVRIHGMSRSTSDLAMAFSSVLIERVMAWLALMLLALLGLAFSPVALPSEITYLVWVGVFLLVLAVLVLMHQPLRDLTYRFLPFVYFLIFMPIMFLAVQIPISFAGVGVREGGFIYFFGLVGMSAEAAIVLSLVYFIITVIVITIPGSWLYSIHGLSSARKN